MDQTTASSTPSFEVEPLQDGLPFGATVKGLERSHLEISEVRRVLNAIWVDKGVILFRDGEDGPQMQIELSQVFGELMGQHFRDTWVDDRPELIQIKYRPEDGVAYDVGGERLGGLLPWHTDAIYSDTLNHGGILRPIQLPARGGQTGFIDKIAAYAALPDDLKSAIEGLSVVYVTDLNIVNSKFMRPKQIRFLKGAQSFLAICRRQYQYPRVTHPLVFEQAETGRKVLNFSPWFADGVLELGGPEGDALLRELVEHMTHDNQTYFHDWRMGDMLLWDNWRTLHCGAGLPADETRVMHRTTIAGDYQLGRKLDGGGAQPKFDV